MDVKNIILNHWYKALSEKKFCSNWELLKFETAKYLRKQGSLMAKERRIQEANIIAKLASVSSLSCPNEDEQAELVTLQLELDKLYKNKAEGAFIRSRKQWMEKGEQNSAYFFGLEKCHFKNNSVEQLKIDGVVTDDHAKISQFCTDFYSRLYSSKFSELSASDFFLLYLWTRL